MKEENHLSESIAIIIVTHNSQAYLSYCLESIASQTLKPKQIIVVDSGSTATDYLNELSERHPFTLHSEPDNIGFCAANNVAMNYVESSIDYVLFLNPDAFLSPSFLKESVYTLNDPLAKEVGALSGILLGYDVTQNKPNGLIDSTGVFQSWYGRWYDRGQGENLDVLSKCYFRSQFVPALCGALLFCRLTALKSVELSPGVIFDPEFFMYKEDIDLSLRLRRAGWNLLYLPDLIAYHCRGWSKDRRQIPLAMRLLSARNEMKIHARALSPYFFYSAVKYFCVRAFGI